MHDIKSYSIIVLSLLYVMLWHILPHTAGMILNHTLCNIVAYYVTLNYIREHEMMNDKSRVSNVFFPLNLHTKSLGSFAFFLALIVGV